MNSCFDWIESNGERADWVDVFLVFLRPLLRLRRLLLGSSRTLAKLPRGKIYILKVRFVKICEMYETLHKTVLMWFISSKILFKQFYACQKAVVLLFSQNLNHCHCSVWRIPLIALKENYFLAWGQHPRTSLQKLTSLSFFLPHIQWIIFTQNVWQTKRNSNAHYPVNFFCFTFS